MVKQATGTGKTVEEAMEAAKAELGIKDGDDFEIIETVQPQKKTLGLFGGSPAKVTLSFGKEEPVKAEVKPQKQTTEKKPIEDKTEKKQSAKTENKANKAAKPIIELDDEQKTPVAEGSEDYAAVSCTVDYLTEVLEKMGVTEITTAVFKTDDGFEIAFDGKGLGVAIGRKGDTLDSLQHLCSLVMNRNHQEYIRLTINPSGYREKRRNTLVEQAVKYANKAKEKQVNYSLEPMNAYERRIVHNAVQTVEGVLSWSIGENDNRRVIIGTSKDNRTLRASGNGRRDNRGGKGRGNRNGRGRNDRRPAYDQTPTREPRKDSDSMPLYGIIK